MCPSPGATCNGGGCHPHCSAHDGGVRVKGRWGKDDLDFRVGGREPCPCQSMGGCDATYRRAKSRSRSGRRRKKDSKKGGEESDDERGRRRSRRVDANLPRSMSERLAVAEERIEHLRDRSGFGLDGINPFHGSGVQRFGGSGFPDGSFPHRSGGIDLGSKSTFSPQFHASCYTHANTAWDSVHGTSVWKGLQD